MDWSWWEDKKQGNLESSIHAPDEACVPIYAILCERSGKYLSQRKGVKSGILGELRKT